MGKAMEKFEGQILVDGGGMVVCGLQERFIWQITAFRRKNT